MQLHSKVSKLETNIKTIETKHALELDELQQSYEEKIGVLLRQLRGIKVENADEELRKRIEIEKSRNDTLENSNLELLTKNSDFQKQCDELKNKLNMVGVSFHVLNQIKQQHSFLQKLAKKAEAVNDFLTPVKMPRTRNKQDVTFTLDSSNELIDDPSQDPDWTQTPIGKFILRNKKQGESLAEISNIVGTKRTSEGGCSCTTNCSKRVCGCKKLNKSCSRSCKCSKEVCTNCDNDSIDENSEKRIR